MEAAQADPLSDGDLSRGGGGGGVNQAKPKSELWRPTSLTLMQHVHTGQHLNYQD